jgi:hypothetical protein
MSSEKQVINKTAALVDGELVTVTVYGPVKRRRCRDVAFLILFLGFWVGMFIIANVALKYGDYKRL